MKVLIADKINEKSLDLFSPHEIGSDYRPEITPYDFLQAIPEYDGLIVRSRTKVTGEVIRKAASLKIIGRVGSGVDNIDVAAAKTKNVTVVNAPDSNSQSVAEHAVGLMLALLRKYPSAFSSMKEGLWLKKELTGSELNGKTVGIVGYGRIGKIVGKIVTAFGAKVVIFSRSYQICTLPALFEKSDIITIHLPFTTDTEKIITYSLMSKMKPGAYLVNTSRGEITDEEGLYKLLTARAIAGAALDVFSEEPLPADSKFRKLDNCILTPHISASTKEALIRGSITVVNDVINVLSGREAENPVVK